jgi:hypothetical protein
MKKLFLMSAFALMAVAANATEPVGSVVTTSCGKRVMTVSSNDGFLNKEDYYDYMRDLNEVECGTREMPKEIADRF